MDKKCLIILSTKSSGSSACQRFLSLTGKVRCVEKTRHFENETLFWTKAASVLGLPQVDMLDSEVPMGPTKAREELQKLVYDNVGVYAPPGDDEAFVFDAWRRLCERYAPVFLEKSPHHLLQWSNLELIRRAMDALPDVEFHLLGLVRNPMDTLYSAWRRWRTDPERNQFQWLLAYSNLLRLQCLLGDKVNIVRYEDVVSDPSTLAREFSFAGVDTVDIPADHFHRNSVGQWRRDRLFGFELSSEVIDVGIQYGYPAESMRNGKARSWRPYRALARARHALNAPLLGRLRGRRSTGGSPA